MPFYPPFNMPFFYNNYRYPTNFSNQKKHTKKLLKTQQKII